MADKINVYDYIREKSARAPYLVHAKNILTKHDSKKFKKDLPVLTLFANQYKIYLEENLKLKGTSKEVIKKRVKLLNNYYDFFKKYDDENDKKIEKIFTSQSKFRPTVLEEFLTILFNNVVEECLTEASAKRIQVGAVKAYANLYFYGKNFEEFATKPTLGINVKDQDFAIYRKVNIQMDDNAAISTSIPVVALECKTYIDKTMFEGSVATAEKLKAGNPYTFFGIVAENYDIDSSVVPAYSRIDQIYILRKGSRKSDWKPIDAQVVLKLVEDVRNHLKKQWVDIEKKLSEDGFLI